MERVPTGLDELDRALGGGLVAGQVVLLGGDPGIGKSTLLLQALASDGAQAVALRDAARNRRSRSRCARGASRSNGGRAPARRDAARAHRSARSRPREPSVAVVDSIQTLWSDTLQSAPGSVAQVRECAAQLTRHAKRAGTRSS